MEKQERGSIGYFATYRPPVPLDIFSCPNPPTSKPDELEMTDGKSYNYNGQVIPPSALKTILGRPAMTSEATPSDVDLGRVTGLLMVSERFDGLETLHIALRFNDCPPRMKVFRFAEVYGSFDEVRMEDSGCIAGDYLVYVSTMQPNPKRRQPWTAVYKTHLKTGDTKRLTPKGVADLSPAVSPNGKMIAVASFQAKGWSGEIENLQTDIFVVNVEEPLNRRLAVKNGGWPTWGSDKVLFFHRKEEEKDMKWGVFRAADVDKGVVKDTPRVTPDDIDAMTPAAIDATTVVVATIRKKSTFTDVRDEAQYRHIEVFHFNSTGEPKVEAVQITQKIRAKGDHYNPFVIKGKEGIDRIGYHRVKSHLLGTDNIVARQSNKIMSPHSDIGLFRVAGAFPTFSPDGSKLAFVDNEFKAVWLADSHGLRVVHETEGVDNVFSPVFGQNPDLDVLYVCMGPSFHAKEAVELYAIFDVSTTPQEAQMLTTGGYNNAFPFTNPQGSRLVFRSTRDGGSENYKNLYILEDALSGEYGEDGRVTRLTQGNWIDTHCQWSPRGDWIVFSSTRDMAEKAPKGFLDAGHYAVFMVNPDDPTVVVRVIACRYDPRIKINDSLGHITHPFFSPDGKSLVVTADLAAVSVDPISLPLFVHSVRPYGDIFIVDIDPDDMTKNKDLKKFKRITHSRYENGIATWTMYSTADPNAAWNLILYDPDSYTPACPYAHADGGESWHMTGHLCIPNRCC